MNNQNLDNIDQVQDLNNQLLNPNLSLQGNVVPNLSVENTGESLDLQNGVPVNPVPDSNPQVINNQGDINVDKSKKINKKIIFIAVIVIVILTISYLIYSYIIGGKVSEVSPINNSIAYIKEGELYLYSPVTKETIIIDSEIDSNFISANYSPVSNDLVSYLISGELELYEISTNKKIVIDSNVKYQLFTDDGNYIVYSYNNKNNISIFDIKNNESKDIVFEEDEITDEYSFSLSSFYVYDTIIIYITANNDIYIYNMNTEDEPELIASDTINFSYSEKYETLYYSLIGEYGSKNYFGYNYISDEYIYEKTGLSYLINHNMDDNQFIYTKEELDYNTFVEDDEFNNDPVYTENNVVVCDLETYLLNIGCTYEDYKENNTIYTSVNIDKSELNNSIRDELSNLELSTLYIEKNNIIKKIGSGIINNSLYLNDEKILIFDNYSSDIPIKISEINEFSDYEEYYDNSLSINYYYNDTLVKLPIKELMKNAVVLNEFLYLTTFEGLCYKIDYINLSDELELVSENASFIYSYEDFIVLGNSYVEGNMFLSDYEIIGFNSSAESISIQGVSNHNIYDFDNNNKYIVGDCKDLSCNLINIVNEDIILSDVYSINFYDKDFAYVASDYDSETYTYNLYLYENGELSLIAESVESDTVRYFNN